MSDKKSSDQYGAEEGKEALRGCATWCVEDTARAAEGKAEGE